AGGRATSASSTATRALASAIVHSQSSSSTGDAPATSAGITRADGRAGAASGTLASEVAEIAGLEAGGGTGGGAITPLATSDPTRGAPDQRDSFQIETSPSCQPTIRPPVPSSNTAGRVDKIRPSEVNSRPYLWGLTNPQRCSR